MNLTIRALVDENFIYARALNSLGVDFYLDPDRTLREVCRTMGLNKGQVIKTFYFFDQSHRFSFQELKKLPLEIVIEYLKHSHHMFIKDKLPYISKLVLNYPRLTDLKLIFPDFVEEFINHIYEEEDSLFKYVSLLLDLNKTYSQRRQRELIPFRSFSLKKAFREHKDEDELAGIRNLVEQNQDSDIHWQVISREIKAFDREMWYHSEIENNILYPKSIALETSVLNRIQELSRLN